MQVGEALLNVGRGMVAFIGFGFAITVLAITLTVFAHMMRDRRTPPPADAVDAIVKGFIMALAAAIITTAFLKALS